MGVHKRQKYFLSYITTWTLKYFIFFQVILSHRLYGASGISWTVFLQNIFFFINKLSRIYCSTSCKQITSILNKFVSCNHWASSLIYLNFPYFGSIKNRDYKIISALAPCLKGMQTNKGQLRRIFSNWSFIFSNPIFSHSFKSHFLLQLHPSPRNS